MENPASELEAYRAAGVDVRAMDDALEGLKRQLRPTLTFRRETRLDIGHFANIIDLGSVWIAVSTDGVGSKSLIAQWMGKYDTIGIDCVASNVNDVLCVGAEPLSMVDYLAIHSVDGHAIEEIGKGLREGARQAKISISGGEISQMPDVISQHGPGMGFDLDGTCVGSLEPGTAVTGELIRKGDIIIGLPSSGVHCNGLSLARRAFQIDGDRPENLHAYLPELGRSIGEELLTPALIYVGPVMAIREAGIKLKGLVHVTSGGFLKLPRLAADVGYVIDKLPDPHPIFKLIQQRAPEPVRDEEMYENFNMGVGFCLIVAPEEETRVLDVTARHGLDAMKIGYVTEDPDRTVRVEPVGLEGSKGKGFRKAA